MKRTLNTFLIVMAVLLALVACSLQNVVTDELVSATLITTDKTRSLVAEVDFDILKVAKWMYTAEKADNGLETGATTTEVELKDGKTDLLSQGSWNFNLYGYDSSNNLICSGSIENATVTTTKHDVKITVKPSQTKNGKGTLSILDSIAVIGNGVKYTGNEYVKSITVTDSGDSPVTLAYDESNKLNKATVKSGLYKVIITFTDKANDGTEYTAASGTKYVNVYDNLTTTVSGTIDENGQSADISQKAGIVKASVEIKNVAVENGKNKDEVKVELSTSAVGAEKKTNVTFPASSIAMDTGATLSLAVETSSFEASKSNSSYSVETTDGTAVAGVTFNLTGTTTSSFASGVTVETYIEPGLGTKDSLTIKFIGEDESGTTPDIVYYENSTGLLKFKVFHFSTYAIYSKGITAYDEDSLKTAINNASTGDTATEIRIIKDIPLSASIEIKESKNVKIDLNGHTVIATNNAFIIEGAKAEFSGTGVIEETQGNQSFPLRVLGGVSSVTSGYTTVTVGENITLKGWGGINIPSNSGKYYGSIVTMKGTIEGLLDADGSGINVNGKIQPKINEDGSVVGNPPVVNVENATIKVGGNAIYGAGYAVIYIKNCTMDADTTISLKAGTVTIESGTYTATGVFDEHLEDTSNGSVDTGAPLSMTSNDSYAGKLDVTVNGGTFTSTNGYAVYEGIPVRKGTETAAAKASYVTLTINDGTFTGNSSLGAVKLNNMKNNVVKVIKGGKFSSDPSTYLVDGYKATEVDGSYKVESSAST